MCLGRVGAHLPNDAFDHPVLGKLKRSEPVIARAALENVVVRAALEFVVIAAAVKLVVSEAAVESIEARVAICEVGGATRLE